MKSTVKALALSALTALALGAAATPATAATTRGPLPDPERFSSTATGWGWFVTADASTINNWAGTYNMRVIDVEVDSPTTFTATLVQNYGTYDRGVVGATSWVVNQTPASLATALDGKRLIDLERYTIATGETRFAAVMVANPVGGNYHDYKYYFNGTTATINAWVAQNNGRLVDVDYVSPGRYDAVLIPNTGVDLQDWVWYPDATVDTVNTEIQNYDSRVVVLEPTTSGHFAMILRRHDSTVNYWGWHPSLSFQQLIDVQADNGYRPIQVTRYLNNGEWRFAVVFIETV